MEKKNRIEHEMKIQNVKRYRKVRYKLERDKTSEEIIKYWGLKVLSPAGTEVTKNTMMFENFK